MAAAPAKEVTTRQVTAIRFGFYTEDEVRKLSVVQVTSPIIFDNMKVPVYDGLYDQRMGPVDMMDRCATCRLGYDKCPGHFGHIELPVPVYNPLVFKVMYKMLRCMCFNCHRFKMAQETVDLYSAKLRRLVQGDLVKAVELRPERVLKTMELAEFMSSTDVEQVEQTAKEVRAEAAATKPAVAPGAGRQVTQLTLEAMQETISEFLGKMNGTRCANCKMHSPSIKKQGANKLFCVWGSRKALADNVKSGHTFRNVLDRLSGNFLGELEQGMKDELATAAGKRKRARAATADEDGDEAAKTAKNDPSAIVKTGAYGNEGDFVEDDEAQEVRGLAGSKEDGEGDEVELYGDLHTGVLATTDAPGTSGRGGKSRRTQLDAELDGLDVATKYLTPTEVEQHLRLLWRHEWPLLSLIYSAQVVPRRGERHGTRLMTEQEARAAYTMFFLKVIAVPPNKFRPPSKVGEELYEHAHNVILSKAIEVCIELTNLASDLETAARQQAAGGVGADPQQLIQKAMSRRVALWLELQNHVCSFIDSTTAEGTNNEKTQGIRQQLEKKEGLFRKNMMGKRVNFAARSVISPDPYIGVGEIGVPPYFAKRLSFPERVTPWNVERLRAAVVVGADSHPGAVAVEEVSTGKMILLGNLPLQRRQALAKQLLSNTAAWSQTSAPAKPGAGGSKGAPGGPSSASDGGNYIVYRHLQDGDLMLTNRQPTLHKPGLMAHRARVLKGERTIRFHYANCATFNADFDGDEINLHLPQDQLGRTEGYVIVHADQQYIVPTDGKPIRGLIQDHVVAATLISKRGSWYTRDQYRQLVFVACTPWAGKGPLAAAAAAAALATGKERDKVTVVMQGRAHDIELEPPCMLKPQPLWSGKQIISTVVSYFTRGMPPLTFTAGGKVPASYWGATSGEDEMEFRTGSLVRGVVDKNAFTKYGLVHAVQELYGNVVAGKLLSAFSRLFTYYLQLHGFTCGMDDLLLVPSSETRRSALLATAEARAVQASKELLRDKTKDAEAGLPAAVMEDPERHQLELLREEIRVSAALSERYRANRDTGKAHDMKGSGTMHALSSEVIKVCLPGGQVKAFPRNCLSLMTITGAKGSLVNFSQISCLLGQQELEGRRPPRMASGKTLPCFRPYDGGGRSNGFIGDRFLTGLRPQEYYFHCMAGREGLVDTAVKTSRSGYLQRCLVKNLETLRVHYDGTVRDNCDASIVQFAYGEDGLDVMNTSYIKQYAFLARNAQRFGQVVDRGPAMEASKTACLTGREAHVAAVVRERASLLATATHQEAEGQKGEAAATRRRAAALLDGLPVSALHPPSVLGATSEAFSDALLSYVDRNPDGLLAAGTGTGKKGEKAKGAGGGSGRGRVDGDVFAELMLLKYMRALAAPGEAVGVLAAQSVGEPSTQMTLNTFHMAGRGEANVTLGIPRLREILMTATRTIRTPVMTLPLVPGKTLSDAHVLANRLRRLRLAECLSGITVEEAPVMEVPEMEGGYGRSYRVTLHFFDPTEFPREAHLSFADLVAVFKNQFSRRLLMEVEKEARRKSGVAIGRVDVSTVKDGETAGGGASAGEADGDGEAGGSQRGGAKAARKSDKDDDFEDAEDDEELREGKLRFRGGRGEAATYDAGDEEDEQAAAEARRAAERRGLGVADGEEEDEEGDGDDEEVGRAGGDNEEQDPVEQDRALVDPVSATAAGPSADPDIDTVNHTCSLSVTLPLTSAKLLMLEVVERVAASTLVRVTPRIDKVYVVEGHGKELTRVQTDGVNFEGAWAHSDIADVTGITTNDIYAMLATYGVEAARATIMREVQSVFSAYGIGVDPRHLSLIADFMAHQGGYRACSRVGIETSVSPLLKMSFETASHFLTDATLRGTVDNLKSPAARLCVGRVVELGTGTVELVQELGL